MGFSYAGADAPVLEDISFTAQPGTTTAIIGSTGSGKTTLVSLIPRLYVPTEGQVLIDATPTTSLARQDIVQRVSLVPQKAYLLAARWPLTCASDGPKPPMKSSGRRCAWPKLTSLRT